MVEDYIIQPFVSGREFTIDIFCDFEGNPIYITPRERMQVRAGEVLKTQICIDKIRKPCDIAFRIMQHRWKIPYEQMIYVGDNPSKDFQACRQLGMRWLYFKNENGLYHDTCEMSKMVCSITEISKKIVIL